MEGKFHQVKRMLQAVGQQVCLFEANFNGTTPALIQPLQLVQLENDRCWVKISSKFHDRYWYNLLVYVIYRRKASIVRKEPPCIGCQKHIRAVFWYVIGEWIDFYRFAMASVFNGKNDQFIKKEESIEKIIYLPPLSSSLSSLQAVNHASSKLPEWNPSKC